MRTLIALAAALALPAPAAAATLTEVPPLELRGGLNDTCLQSTGVPGEVALESGDGVRLVHAARTGFTLGQRIVFPDGFECRAIAGRPSGAGVIVAVDDGEVLVSIREPGGPWGAPQPIFAGEEQSIDEIQAAVSDRGDVLVVNQVSELNETHLRVVRRAPGAAFGAPETVTAARVERLVTPALAATGEAFLMSTRVIRSRPPLRAPVSVRIAPPGAPFGAPTDVVDGRWLSSPALAVAADGRALVAAVQGDALVVAERAPGAAFGPALAVATGAGHGIAADAAIAADGAAAVIWQRIFKGDAVVVTRPGAGPFSAPFTALQGEPPIPVTYDPFFFSESFYVSLGPSADVTFDDAGDSVALTADGRAALATVIDTAPGERLAGSAALATFPLAAGPATASTTGSHTAAYLETGNPIILPDGSPAVIWSEDLPGNGRIRLHLGAEGILERPDPPTPRVTVGTPRDRTLEPDEELVLPVTCSAACDVRAALETLDGSTESVRLSRAGTRTLSLSNVAPRLTPRSRPIRVHLTYGAPGALHPRERTLTLRLRTTVRPLRAIDVKARRVGNNVRVTWRTTRTADPLTFFFVTGDDTREWNGDPLVVKALEPESETGRSFSATLRNARAVRWVTVRTPIDFSPGPKTTVKVIR